MEDIRKKLKLAASQTGLSEEIITGVYIREGIIDRIWQSEAAIGVANSPIEDRRGLESAASPLASRNAPAFAPRARFILKGASVFQILNGSPHRPTADIDLLGFGSNNEADLKALFTEICSLNLDDGLVFSDIATDILQKGAKYQGVRLLISGNLDTIPFKTQVDISFNHVITPNAVETEFPTLLGRTPPKVRAYPIETIVAEKLEAITSIGIRNSRLKDYYDLLYLSRNYKFDGSILSGSKSLL